MDERLENRASVDWESVDEEILCPLCDYNLRGLVEPRCPECGYRFDWPELLDPTLRLHPYVFEHHAERNIWSFWRTVRGTLRPKRFWTSLHPAQPSYVRRLVIYVLIITGFTLATFSAAWVLPIAVETAHSNAQSRRWELRFYPTKSDRAAAQRDWIKKTYGTLDAYLDAACPRTLSWPFAASIWAVTKQQILLALLFCSWPELTLVSLLIFRWSMRRARVNPRHILRTVVYSFDTATWIGATAVLLVAVLALTNAGLTGWQLSASTMAVVLLLSITVMVYRVYVAYRHYLRFDHPLATVLASQTIVMLVSFNVLLLVAIW